MTGKYTDTQIQAVWEEFRIWATCRRWQVVCATLLDARSKLAFTAQQRDDWRQRALDAEEHRDNFRRMWEEEVKLVLEATTLYQDDLNRVRDDCKRFIAQRDAAVDKLTFMDLLDCKSQNHTDWTKPVQFRHYNSETWIDAIVIESYGEWAALRYPHADTGSGNAICQKKATDKNVRNTPNK